MTHAHKVRVELVQGTTYTTLTQHFVRKEVYEMTLDQWENVRNAQTADGKNYFALTDKDTTQLAPQTTERPDVVKGGGITITHNVPKAMTREEAEKAGLGAFFRRDLPTGDTGAALAGTGGEAEHYEGPSGYEGLDDEQEVGTVAGTTVDTPVETSEAPQTAQTAPAAATPKAKPVIISKGGKKSLPSDAVKV